MDNIVTLTHRNVCKDGFTVVDTVDSVFLDLPAPWDAIEHAKKALRKDRTTRICCFSPCMEQVQRTVISLNDAGFTEITMYETLIRPHQVDILDSLPSIRTVSTQLKESDVRREAKRLRQIAASHRGKTGSGEKRKRGQVEVEEGASSALTQNEPGKRAKTEEVEELSKTETTISTAARIEIEEERMVVDEVTPVQRDTDVITYSEPSKLNVSKAFPEVRGHTSYLTFAVLLPAFATSKSVEANGDISSSSEGGISTGTAS